VTSTEEFTAEEKAVIRSLVSERIAQIENRGPSTYSRITTTLEDGTEIHVIAPLDRAITWDEIKAGTVTNVEAVEL
jgi:hypothetical protein